MSIHTLKKLSTSESQNRFGETPLPFAPQVKMADGSFVVPQQYLNVTRNLTTLEAVISGISFSDQYPIFAGEISNVLYLQVGVIGTENYPSSAQQASQVKIVYGRRWLIEPTTTTSEVVQTALLAIKKAREHELREKVVITINQGQNKTTPFNTHMDLPQMVGNADMFVPNAQTLQQQIDELEKTVCVGDLQIRVTNNHALAVNRALVELDLVKSNGLDNSDFQAHFPELSGQRLSLLCDTDSSADLLHELMSQLIRISDRHIEETLSFNGFNRFSRTVSINTLAEFSYQSRNVKNKDPRFAEHFKKMSYQVDSSKAPPFAPGRLGDKQRSALEKFDVKAGYAPTQDTKPETQSFSA